MVNEIKITGLAMDDIELQKCEEGRTSAIITLAINRQHPHTGEYQTDFIDVDIYDNVAENAAKTFGKGSTIAVSGRVENTTIKLSNGPTFKTLRVIGEQLSSPASAASVKPKNQHQNHQRQTLNNRNQRFSINQQQNQNAKYNPSSNIMHDILNDSTTSSNTVIRRGNSFPR